jgi:hypothetical protein
MGPRLFALTVIALTVALAGCAGSLVGTVSPAPSGCRTGLPEAGIHNPDRLHVLQPCAHASGVVVDVAHEDDGDYHVWFRPDKGFEYLLNAENHFQGKPAMLAEITPDCPLDTNPPNGAAAAHCPKTQLLIPDLGQHIAITGPWVLDVAHGWQEIHPVDSIQILAV